MVDEIERIREIPDPTQRALAAAESINGCKKNIEELAEIRRLSISQLVNDGIPRQEIAALLGTTKGRITQILSKSNSKPRTD